MSELAHRKPVVTEGRHDFIDPESGQMIPAWVIGLKWWKGEQQYGAYYAFSDEPTEAERTAALRNLQEQAGVEVHGA